MILLKPKPERKLLTSIFMYKRLNITKKQTAETCIVFAIILILAGLYTGLRAFFLGATTLLLVTLVMPSVFAPMAFLWFGFSKVLGWVSSRLLLGFVFYFLVTPVGIFRRLSGKDRLQLTRFKKDTSSTFTIREHTFISSDLKAPY